jgi:hypothetical protein
MENDDGLASLGSSAAPEAESVRPGGRFRVGDRVQWRTFLGTVAEITERNTIVRWDLRAEYLERGGSRRSIRPMFEPSQKDDSELLLVGRDLPPEAGQPTEAKP